MVRFRVYGELACFARPELKRQIVTYDVPTPSAMVGVISSILWKPAISWYIKGITVLNPIKTLAIARNELVKKISCEKANDASAKGYRIYIDSTERVVGRMQRRLLYLADVDYLVDADFTFVGDAEALEREEGIDPRAKYSQMFYRRLERGQSFKNAYLGMRECVAFVEPVPKALPVSAIANLPEGNRDLGYMLHSLDYGKEEKDIVPRYYRAIITQGHITVPPPWSDEVMG